MSYILKTPLLQSAFIPARTVGAITPNSSQISHSVMAVAPISLGRKILPCPSIVIIFLSSFIGMLFLIKLNSSADILLHIFQLVRQGFHVLAYLLGGDFGVNLGGLYVGMPQKAAHRFNGYTVRQKYGRGVRVACDMENTYHLRIWKNVENKPITCCELVDFLYSASMIGKQFNTEY